MKRFNGLSQAVLPVVGPPLLAIGEFEATEGRKSMQCRWWNIAFSLIRQSVPLIYTV
jgi:hypothetical protein